MHDIRLIRDDPAAFDAALARRRLEPQSPRLLGLDSERRQAITQAEEAQAAANAAAREVGAAKARGDEEAFQRLRAEVAEAKARIADLQTVAKEYDAKLSLALMELPNLPAEDVPDGADEDDNVEIRRVGEKRQFDFQPVEHYQLAAVQDGMDFETAAKLSGSRFVLLKGGVARLHRALAQFMLDTHVDEHGLTEANVPVLVRDEMMVGTGQLPKFAEDSYFAASMAARDELAEKAIKQAFTEARKKSLLSGKTSFLETFQNVMSDADTREDFWLVPTAEVPLTNTVAGLTLDETALPLRYVAHTPCFRSEAGSAGRDTSGMLRQHQFEKVEMVSITHPNESDAEHQRMTKCAETILDKLGLPYRTVTLCAGDIGFGAVRTHDIEVWLPGQNAYREISSVSTCGAFQARRMNARFKPAGGGKPEFVHTLNGSGLAVGRTLIAVLENGQRADGSVEIPDVLRPYLGGRSLLSETGLFI